MYVRRKQGCPVGLARVTREVDDGINPLKQRCERDGCSGCAEIDDMRRFRGKATPFVREWAAAGSIVDDALLVGKTPALIVRQTKASNSRWLLVLLEDPLRVFSIPVHGTTDDTKLQADGNGHGNVVVLVARRESTPDDLSPQEVLFLSVPN